MNKKEKKAGLIAGISLIVMAIAAGFAYGYVYNTFMNNSGEMMQQNLLENKSLFMAGLAAWVVIFATDLIVAGALYHFFSSNMKRISALTAFIRIAYTFVLGAAICQLVGILPLLQGYETSHEIQSHFASFEKIWSAGLILFGFHLIGLGYLSAKSKFIPNFFAYLLYLAGISYVLIHAAKQFALYSQDIIASAETILALPMALSEILLAAWLIYKGLKRLDKLNY